MNELTHIATRISCLSKYAACFDPCILGNWFLSKGNSMRFWRHLLQSNNNYSLTIKLHIKLRWENDRDLVIIRIYDLSPFSSHYLRYLWMASTLHKIYFSNHIIYFILNFHPVDPYCLIFWCVSNFACRNLGPASWIFVQVGHWCMEFW